MYFLELDNREKINARISVPISIITLLAGGYIYLLFNLKDIEGVTWIALFFSFFSLYSISLITSIIYTGKAYYNYEYMYLPSLANLNEESLQLESYIDHCIVAGDEDIQNREQRIIEEVQSNLYEHFMNATDINTKLNRKKLNYLRKAGLSILASLIFGTACMIPVIFGKAEEVQKVKIVESINTKGGKISD
jgi:hypothetical protein